MALFATLPIAFYFLLVELLAGTVALLLVTEIRRDVPRGFFQFMGVTCVLTLLLAVGARGGLPETLSAAAGPDVPALLTALAGLALYTVFTFRGESTWRLVAGAVSLVGLTTALIAGILGHFAVTGPTLTGTLALASFGLAALALGSSMLGMLLGHWYLVAPLLSSAPLIRINAILIVTLIAQGALIAYLVTGPSPSGLSILDFGPVFWIRVLFGIGFPVVMAAFVWYSCHIRAMRTATGILYLATTSVLMGDVAAKVMFFLTSVPV